MVIRKLHRIAGIVMLLPLIGWAVTGAVFFLKPGYAGAYETLPVKSYPFETEIKLTPDEDAAFKKSAAAVKELVGVIGV